MSGYALHNVTLDATAFPLGQAAPDPEPLVIVERVLQALGPDLAAPADPFGLSGGTALLGKERLRICLCAQRPVLPTQVIHIFLTDDYVC